jgi:hypothetical protein
MSAISKSRLALAHDEVAGRFGEKEGRQQVARARNELHPEHPAPGRELKQPEVVRSPGSPRDEIIAQECALQADHNGKLLQGGEAPAQFRRGNFGNVGRRHDASGAHAEAADQAVNDKYRG